MRPHRQAQPSGVDLSSESRIVNDAPASSSIVARMTSALFVSNARLVSPTRGGAGCVYPAFAGYVGIDSVVQNELQTLGHAWRCMSTPFHHGSSRFRVICGRHIRMNLRLAAAQDLRPGPVSVRAQRHPDCTPSRSRRESLSRFLGPARRPELFDREPRSMLEQAAPSSSRPRPCPSSRHSAHDRIDVGAAGQQQLGDFVPAAHGSEPERHARALPPSSVTTDSLGSRPRSSNVATISSRFTRTAMASRPPRKMWISFGSRPSRCIRNTASRSPRATAARGVSSAPFWSSRRAVS